MPNVFLVMSTRSGIPGMTLRGRRGSTYVFLAAESLWYNHPKRRKQPVFPFRAVLFRDNCRKCLASQTKAVLFPFRAKPGSKHNGKKEQQEGRPQGREPPLPFTRAWRRLTYSSLAYFCQAAAPPMRSLFGILESISKTHEVAMEGSVTGYYVS